jgi:hypothetical protein
MFFGPFIHSVFLNHTQIENFQCVGHTFSPIGNRLQPRARKFIAFKTVFHFFILNALVHFTVTIDSEQFKSGAITVIIAASFAPELLVRQIIPFQKSISVFLVFFANVQRAIEAVFSARSG